MIKQYLNNANLKCYVKRIIQINLLRELKLNLKENVKKRQSSSNNQKIRKIIRRSCFIMVHFMRDSLIMLTISMGLVHFIIVKRKFVIQATGKIIISMVLVISLIRSSTKVDTNLKQRNISRLTIKILVKQMKRV